VDHGSPRGCLLPALVLALAVSPLELGAGGKDKARELFANMETKLTGAGTVEVVLKGKGAEARLGVYALEAKWLLAPGNKSRLEMKIRLADRKLEAENHELFQTTMVSDGTKVKVVSVRGRHRLAKKTDEVEDSKVEVKEEPKGADRQAKRLAFLCRAGLGLTIFARLEPQDWEAKDVAVVSDFKLGKREKVRGQEAQAVEYLLKLNDKQAMPMTVWIDVETHLPLRRTVADKTFGLEEDYRIQLDKKIPAETFAVPGK
jgi:hypothetical protein